MGVKSALPSAPLTYCLLIAEILLLFHACSSTAGLRPSTDLTPRPNDTGICKSVDIRNNINAFDNLKGCRVVEGFVQILLFDNAHESQFSNISFPDLREITDFLLLYRVNGLRTLATLFPNLAVIRGENTFYNHAFILFEMPSLQEIGLYSLTDIVTGYVRIDKNPSLCFLNSINWDLIVHEKGENFIKNAKPENECPKCLGDESKDDKNETACPVAKAKTQFPEGVRHLCWNRKHCQKTCPKDCHACNDLGECCSRNCLGGCSNDNKNRCHVCRHITIGNNERCDTMCNHLGEYEFLKRRCITKAECLAMKRPIDFAGDTYSKLQEYPYKTFQHECILHCPPNFMEDYENRTCKPCEGRCKKYCPTAIIDSIQSTEELRGCTHINGSLEIQIRGGKNIINKLEENLNMIEEIDGYLKIVRSFPLMSLHFLKNLKVIRGNTLESSKYVFIVLDNQNLQDLWNFTNRELRVDKGRLFFHFNPKLCLHKINTLQEKIKMTPPYTDMEVAANSNGDKTACNIVPMNVTLGVVNTEGAVLEWEPFRGGDYRKLLGYVIYCIPAPDENVTLYDGRDACESNDWKIDDKTINPNETESTKVTHLISQLQPFTKYAYYVTTYTIQSEMNSGQSSIQYFRTLPDEPSTVESVLLSSNSSQSYFVSWQPPRRPNGNITHYIVTGVRVLDYVSVDLNDTSSCSHKPYEEQISHTTTSKSKNDTCICDSSSKPKNPTQKKKFSHTERINQIDFENALQNIVYKKRNKPQSERRKRATDLLFPKQAPIPENDEPVFNTTRNGTDIWKSFKFYVYGKNELYIKNLQHFSYYNIKVQVCRAPGDRVYGEDLRPKCSKPQESQNKLRTLKKVGADNILAVQINNQSTKTISLTWMDPVDPNGNILSYDIEYRRVDIENSKHEARCITYQEFLNFSKMYTLQIEPGNYSLRVRANTHSGKGEYSPYVYFNIDPLATGSGEWVLYLVLALLVCGATGGYLFWKWRREKYMNNMKLIPQINPDYVSTVYVPDDWEVPRKKIEMLKELGQGSFGMVYEGIARDVRGIPLTRCAIKTVNEHATNRERIEFLNEAAVMKAFDTHHVVRLLGVVSQGQPTLVVMELMANGDLKSYLRSHRPDAECFDPNVERQPPTLKRILQMAIEIADGMAYLAAKKFVHRDLAARNCMVSEDLTVKIGDFGMTRDIYETDYYRKGTKGLLPVRWMAPESLKDGVFTSSSDVWSYGVVLWEMATLASQPYQGLSNDQVLRYVIDGGVMEMPENCPDKLYRLMRNCWRHKPTDRPTFLELCTFLLDDANANFSQVSFYHSAAGLEARTSKNNQSTSQDDPSTPLRMAHDLDEKFSNTSSDHDSDLDMDDMNARIEFPSFPSLTNDDSVAVTANFKHSKSGAGS